MGANRGRALFVVAYHMTSFQPNTLSQIFPDHPKIPPLSYSYFNFFDTQPVRVLFDIEMSPALPSPHSLVDFRFIIFVQLTYKTTKRKTEVRYLFFVFCFSSHIKRQKEKRKLMSVFSFFVLACL